ncbi:MAG: hypothetical protein U0174_12830 [Polyangiaceae bacterium]
MKNDDSAKPARSTLSVQRVRRGLRTHLAVGADEGGKAQNAGTWQGHRDGNGFIAVPAV